MSRKTRRPSALAFAQTTTVIVGEPQPSGVELFPQGAVLLLEVIDDVALLLVDPTGERDEHEPQGMRRLSHGTQAIKCHGHRRPGARPRAQPAPNRHSALASVVFLDNTRRFTCVRLSGPHMT
jgi:hypothetical protein